MLLARTDMKDLQYLEAAAENWYQRTHKLRVIWQDESKEHHIRAKAFVLFSIMSKRVLSLARIISNAKLPHQKPFPSGGHITGK
jgi:hypothetical protein